MRRAYYLPVLLCVGLSVAWAGDDLPTLQQAKDLLKGGQASEALAIVTRLQERRRGEDVDRFELFMLKGEIQLKLRDGSAALNAFALARKETDKPEQKDAALAMETLVRHASNLQYRPKDDPTRALDINEAQGRKDAFAALFADQLEPVSKQYERAKTATTMQQIVDFVKPLPVVRALEIASTGKDAKTAEMILVMRDRAFVVLDASLDAAEKQLATIKASADKIVDVDVTQTDPTTRKVTRKKVTRKQGPLPTQVGTLKQIAAGAEKFGPTVADLTDDLQLPAAATKPRLARNDAILKLATGILTADYSQPVQRPGRGG